MSATKSNESSNQKIITLYVVPGCPLCARVYAWLEKHGLQYGIHEVDSNFSAFRKMVRLTHQRNVPVIEVEGRALVRPSAEELASLLL